MTESVRKARIFISAPQSGQRTAVIVVSDASPLIGLAAVGHLDLLQRLYGEVVIPVAVHRELTTSSHAPGAAQVESASWIRVQAVQNRSLMDALSLHLDVGEAEAIALAVDPARMPNCGRKGIR